jgi:hypothetical protein
MTQTTHEQDGARKVEAYFVLEDARIGTLPKHFGARMMTVEHMVYNFMREFVAEYKGAFWDFYELSNGGFYMAPGSDPVQFSVHTNGFEGTLSNHGVLVHVQSPVVSATVPGRVQPSLLCTERVRARP